MNIANVVYPKITELLAECLSIFNILLSCGFIATIFSNIALKDFSIVLLLRYYYKKLFL